MELKKEGKIKSKDDANSIDAELDAADDDDQRTAEEVAMAKLRSQRESMRNNPVADAYADKIKCKLGGGVGSSNKGAGAGRGAAAKKTASLGRSSSDEDEQSGDAAASRDMNSSASYLDSINSVDNIDAIEEEEYDDDVSDEDMEDYGMSEDDLFELVAAKMAEKKAREAEEEREREEEEKRRAAEAAAAVQREEQETKLKSGKEDSQIDKALKYKAALDKQKAALASTDDVEPKKTTSSIGGSWAKNETATAETRRPSRGSWGYFERPNDISKAYGGGKRVGAGYTKDSTSSATSVEETRRKLQAYREKVGIDVQSEKDHAAEIEEALSIGQRAMQRGMYGTAVSALEKVTKWCSTNSQLGGKVFLELAMAYEAVGRTQEAIRVFSTLSKSRIEEVKFNAKRLLYGIEAMQFMRDEAKVKAFQKRNVQDTFIETTGMNTFADNFDDRYNTAWIDMDSGFYKQLTESVVRGIREARQIVLKATGSGEVDRRKVVQALRSMSRYFDDALEKEIEENAPQPEPVAIMDGKPIMAPKRKKERSMDEEIASMEKFILAAPEQMKADLQGEWRLQLLADKRGDGVKYFNTTEAWQTFDMSSSMEFESSIPQGFLGSVNKKGEIEFNDERRIYTQTNVKTGAGGFLQSLMSGSSGAEAGPNGPQQIISVDGVLLVTKYAGKGRTEDLVKNYFAVWRRVEPGTYSSKR